MEQPQFHTVFSLPSYSEDDYRTDSRNVSHQQQFFSELQSPGRSHYTYYRPLFVGRTHSIYFSIFSWVKCIYRLKYRPERARRVFGSQKWEQRTVFTAGPLFFPDLQCQSSIVNCTPLNYTALWSDKHDSFLCIINILSEKRFRELTKLN